MNADIWRKAWMMLDAGPRPIGLEHRLRLGLGRVVGLDCLYSRTNTPHVELIIRKLW